MEVLACIPPAEAVPLEDVAEMANVSPPELLRVVRFTAVAGFLCEPKPDYVAHTDLSRSLLTQPSLVDALAFVGDQRLIATLHTPVTAQSRGCMGLQKRHSTWSNPLLSDSQRQPRLQRQAIAFQRLMRQQALSNENSTIELLLDLMQSISLDNATVVQVGCESNTTARSLAHRHPRTRFVVQLALESNMDTKQKSPGVDSPTTCRLTIQHCPPMAPQPIWNASLYIVHLPMLALLSSSADLMLRTTHLLWTHFEVLRHNRESKVILVANGLVGSGAIDPKADAPARMYDMLLMQTTSDSQVLTTDLIEQMLANVRDATLQLVVQKKSFSKTNATVAFELGITSV